MAVFRVYGVGGDGQPTTILIECDSEAVARNAAVREGLVNTTKVEVVEGEPEHEPVRPPVRMGGRSHGPDLEKFHRQPVWTIAKGVFFGLLMWAGFMMVVAWVLGALDVLTG